MEPHTMPLHSPSPPPLDDDGDGEVGSEEDNLGEISAVSLCSSSGIVDSHDPPSSLRCSSPRMKQATRQLDSSFNHPIEQSRPISTMDSESNRGQVAVASQNCGSESLVHLTNGYSERNDSSSVSTVVACSPKEETGFADFTVFTEQAAHPWCCGFTPLVGIQEKHSSKSFGDQICEPEQAVIMESGPRSYSASKVKENICTNNHCEKRDAALMQPSQDQLQPQEAAAAALDFPSEQPHSGKEDLCDPGDSRLSYDSSLTSWLQEDGESYEDREDKGKRIPAVPQTISACESFSDASFGDDLSFDCPSADLEPNVSSLGSPEEQTDWDQTDDEEELGNFRHSSSFVSNNTAIPQEFKTGVAFHYCNQSATQDSSATSQSETLTDNRFADFRDPGFEHHRDKDCVQTADAEVQILGNLPPSDSFADFCSAPRQEDGEESWAEFKDPRAQVEGKGWTQSQEQVSSLKIEGSTEEDRAGQSAETRRNSCQTSLCDRVQQLLLSSFPEVEVPAVDSVEEVLSLAALLHEQHHSEREEKEEGPRSQSIQTVMWWPHQDFHSAAGLQFQWGGSHTNRTLLSCLHVDIRNIVFIGMKKQPVAVPAFASSLGMLEPTKDSVPAVCSPGHTAVTAQAPPESQVTPDPSTDSVQEALPSSQQDWSSRGLSSSQDGTSPHRAPHFWGRK
ncbi:aftiphilin isoform X3 [Xyrichtys novacula]|uniref:Aftiphilin isoform X3 n=1 Tax=Xyrichtys novacula TaxID=13765 RepID=A0AAV1G1W1_XYRNO|nr:aftiphilin isoform X3 [Xyrichtys novacula]